MPSPYPADYDQFVTAHPSDLASAILKLEARVGKNLDPAPDSLEDRLYTVEQLLTNALVVLAGPPGQIKKGV